MCIRDSLMVERSDVERQPGAYDFAALDARMARYGRLDGVQAYLDLRDPLPAPGALDAWGRFVRAVATRYRGKARGYVFGVPTSDGAASPLPREHAFFVKTTAVNLRAGDDAAATIMGVVRDTDAAWLASVYLEEVAPYVDAIGLQGGSTNAAILS